MSIRTIPNSTRALSRMRRYTTLSLGTAVAAFLGLVVLQATEPAAQVLVAVSGVLVLAQMLFWEKRPPWWLSAPSILLAYGLWVHTVATQTTPVVVLLAALAIALHTSERRRSRPALIVAGGVVLLAPVLVAAASSPSDEWNQWLVVAALSYVSALGFFALNDYAWGLYLEIDAARRIGEDLAVAQERYRFAANLHDIQGHTLHVIRLKTQLAHRLIDSDPAAAKEQLEESELLIAETLSNTRSLAYGDRRVSLASEIANAEQLFSAAGITWTLTGGPADMPHEELFALVMRESTTNILRHAQPTRVTVEVGPGHLVVTNNGSPDTARPPSGLARLGERFEAVDGTLSTRLSHGVFTTEARA